MFCIEPEVTSSLKEVDANIGKMFEKALNKALENEDSLQGRSSVDKGLFCASWL